MINNYLIKKVIVSTVIFLFLCVSIVPSTGTILKQKYKPTLSGNTLYVGGNGTGNYSKIQDAIDNASTDDTIFVYDDSSPYYENVKVNKSVNLVGENRNTTLIDGNGTGNVVYIITNFSTISEFTIINGRTGIFLNKSSNCNIFNNIIKNHTDYGISQKLNTNNKIYNNTIMNVINGIVLYESINNNISSNEITLCSFNGINFRFSNNNILYGNVIFNNWMGLKIEAGSDNIILSNRFLNTTLGNSWGIHIYLSSKNIIKNNHITNHDMGIRIDSNAYYKSKKNKIERNNFITNKIHAQDAQFFELSNNIFDSNYWDNWIGIRLNHSIFQIFPKMIYSPIFHFKFDWHPAQEPYQI